MIKRKIKSGRPKSGDLIFSFGYAKALKKLAIGRLWRQMEQTKLKKKYGLITAIAVIVGTVVGSGIFFRAGRSLDNVNGNIFLGLVAWIVGGAVMFFCVYTFSMMAAQSKGDNVNGLMDYSEEFVGKKYSYFAGWFSAVLYTPCITAIVSWVAAYYTGVLVKIPTDKENSFIFIMTCVYMVFIFTINFFSPKIAGKLQISATVAKLIPLFVLGIVGIILGIANGVDAPNIIREGQRVQGVTMAGFFAGVVTAAYAYDGWIAVAPLNSEIKNSKKNMPIALLVGTAIIVAVYALYYLGLSFVGNQADIVGDGVEAEFVNNAFVKLFSNVGATVLVVFIIISCLGACNGNTMSANRTMFALSTKNWGPKPKVFSEVSKSTDVPYNSALISIALSFFWTLVYWFSENYMSDKYYFDIGDISTIGFYMVCLPIFFMFILKQKKLPWYKRFGMPILALGGAAFMVTALFMSAWERGVIYVSTIIVITLIGFLFYKHKSGNSANKDNIVELVDSSENNYINNDVDGKLIELVDSSESNYINSDATDNHN